MKTIFRLLLALLFVNSAYAQSIIPSSVATIIPGTSIIVGGTNTRVLFDDNGIMGESANFTFDKTNSRIILGTDLGIAREAANVYAQYNSTTAQTWRIYNTRSDINNYERGFTRWSSNILEIGTEQAGTGVARGMLLRSAGILYFSANGSASAMWNIGTTGHLTANTDNVYDIGASGTARPRHVYVGSNVYTTALVLARGGTSYASLQDNGDGVIRLYNGAGTGFSMVQFGGTTSSFPSLKRATTYLQAKLADDSGFAPLQGKLTTDTAYAAGAPAATGYITMYDSNGTAVRVLVANP
jgi:hypothetical protein